MPLFSDSSQRKLDECHPYLQLVCHRVIKIYDFTVITGYRDKATQNRLVEQGKSKVKWPNSKHNRDPSHAVDIAPYPIDWDELNRFYHLGGMMLAAAHDLGIELRWGGDWDRDTEFDDQTFNDLPHFELYNYD